MTEAITQSSDRVETDEEFRRKKRNCLAVGTLGLGFALATTGAMTSVPGLAETKIQSWILGLGLLAYLSYTTIEYYHEYIHQRNLHSELARRFSNKKTAIDAINSIIYSLEATDLSLRSTSWSLVSERSRIFSEMSETVNRTMGDISEIIVHLDQLTLTKNLKDIEKIISSLREYPEKIYKLHNEIMSQQGRDFLTQDTDSTPNYYSTISGLLQELYRLFKTTALHSAESLTELSNSLHQSDRRMFKWHDGVVPFALAIAAGMALIVDIAEKILSQSFNHDIHIWLPPFHCTL
ncbi:hypothetical protein [Sphingopyxis sp. PET50]|uniref:hypothetical protein n=1 Tax=Sphingopyxis sp. PET50 TaxID=2976533 RepID=UPI0021AE3D2A|nr:hypothetical protein [Sphingopyxis sp. PET50]